MNRVEIERREKLDTQEFVEKHLHGIGKPVVVTDAIEHWPARSKWSFAHFKETYGADFAVAPLGLNSDIAKLTKIADYLDYLDTPTAELRGFWVESKTSQPLRSPPTAVTSPHYLLGWYAFQKHPELYEDIKPAPYFVADWLSSLSPPVRDLLEWACGHELWSVYIGPEGSLSELHRDFWHTHACLSQIQGKKRARLFPPTDSEFLYGGKVDPEKPDWATYPLFEQATMYECEISPGDVLFVPSRWWHHVRGLEKSITVSHNFFNDSNVNETMTRLLRNLPKLVPGLEKLRQWREFLDTHAK